MPKITYFAPDGTQHDVDAPVGTTVMENAIKNMVPGIEAECGGACACATCHVYVDEAWIEQDRGPLGCHRGGSMLDFAYRRSG